MTKNYICIISPLYVYSNEEIIEISVHFLYHYLLGKPFEWVLFTVVAHQPCQNVRQDRVSKCDNMGNATILIATVSFL